MKMPYKAYLHSDVSGGNYSHLRLGGSPQSYSTPKPSNDNGNVVKIRPSSAKKKSPAKKAVATRRVTKKTKPRTRST